MRTTIRPATPSDADALSRFAAETFRDAFGAQNRPEDLAAYLAASFGPERQAEEIVRGGVLLAEQGDRLVGWAHLVVGHEAPCAVGPAPAELKRLYVDRASHGRGVAQALMDAVLAEARTAGARTVWLGVWEHNPRAAAFYAKYGFVRVGTQAFRLGDDVQTDWILVRGSEREVRRGDVFWIGPDPDRGGPSHPHVVVQDDVFNRSRVATVIVCATTTNLHRADEPGNVLLDPGEGGLPRQSVVVVSQIASVERERLGERIGSLSDERVDQILAGLRFQQTSFFR